MKELHLIYKGTELIGSQIAGTRERAVHLFAKAKQVSAEGLKAYSAVNDKLPEAWEPEAPDAWKAQDDALIAKRKAA